MRRFRATIVAAEAQWVLHTLSVCVCAALGIHHAMRMHHIVICGLSGSKYFFTYLINSIIFEKEVIEPEMCVLIFSTTFVWNISHSKKNWARYDQKWILAFI
jgi:hypothetical protein